MLLPILYIAATTVQTPAISKEADATSKVVAAAAEQMKAGQTAQALATIEPALADYERRFAKDKHQLYCSYSSTEVLLYMMTAATAKRDAVALNGDRCDALFIKGFALIDLKRVDEGVPLLERAVALAPHHAHFLNELGFAYQAQRDWTKSYDTYRRAAEATAYSDKDRVIAEKTRAWRGMGFALVEQRRWDEAEAMYRQSLKLDPKDEKSPGELRYIAEQRSKN